MSNVILKFYNYLLIDSSNDRVFLVGKGTGDRMYWHENEVRKGKVPNNNRKEFYKINKLIYENIPIKYQIVYETDDEDDAYETENMLTDWFGLENLCNLRDGGKGGWHHSIESRKRISLSKKNKTYEEIFGIERANEIKRKNSQKYIIKYGEEKAKKIKEKMSKSKLGHITSEETKQKISASQKEKSWEEKYGKEKAKQMKYEASCRAINLRKNKTYNEMYGEERAKEINKKRTETRIKNDGYKHTEETKNKLSKKRKGINMIMLYGEEKAQELKTKASLRLKNKSYEERYGKERAEEIKRKKSITLKSVAKTNPNYAGRGKKRGKYKTKSNK